MYYIHVFKGKIMKALTLRPLIIAIGLLACGATYAQDFSQVIVFGDSLSDTGRAKQAYKFGFFYPSFTTNPDPVWSQVLASHYGKTANANTPADPEGTNYAFGGALSGKDTKLPGGVKPQHVKAQISNYLDNKTVDPNALYAVWVGANDLSQASGKDSLTAQQIIIEASNHTVDSVNTLSERGAKTVLVPNLPDLSLTPRLVKGRIKVNGVSRKYTPSERLAVKLGTKTYNTNLYTALNQSNANVIPANTFALLQEAVADKESFGFKNVDGFACKKSLINVLACNERALVEKNANETYVFADDIHPSGRTHRILAQYYQSLIDSPAQMASIVGQLSQSGAVNHQNLYRQLNTLDNGSSSVWLQGAISNAKFDDKQRLNKPNFMLGFDMSGQTHHTGLYVNHQNQTHNPTTYINAESKQLGAGVYHQHDFGDLRLNADIGLDKIDLRTQRTVKWDGAPRLHNAKADGQRYHAGLQLGYDVIKSGATLRPYVGVNAQSTRVKTFTEDNAKLSTALQYDLPTQKSLQGSIGLDMHYPITSVIGVQAGIGHSHEFKDDNLTVGAKLPSVLEYHRNYTMPVAYQNANSTYAHLGAKASFGSTALNAGLTATHASGHTDTGGYVGFQAKF